ncbi:DUF6893 family small protein [Natronosporangium hydrolyticum]
MIRRTLGLAALAGITAIVVKSWPDLVRYLKIRKM